MRVIFLEVEYIGTNYCGFQIQNSSRPDEVTVQEVLEKALKKLFVRDIRVEYTSRTDSGVHARAQGVAFTIDTGIKLSKIKLALNSYLPFDIRVKKILEYEKGWRVRYAVASKVYRYKIDNKKEQSVFDYDFSWQVRQPLSLTLMRQAAALIIGKRDFSMFAKKAKKYDNPVRTVKDIIIRTRGRFIFIDVEADGFLRGMVRNIVAFLVAVGLEQMTLKQVKDVLAKKQYYMNKPAPAKGLCLWKTNYKKD